MLKIKEVKIDKLQPWDKNPRVNDHAVEAVSKSIETFGFNVPIICDQNYTIIAGHTRWKAATKLEMHTVPVTQIEMTESMRKGFAIADNKTGEIADWDFSELRKIIREIVGDEIEISSLGFSDEDVRNLFPVDEIQENSLPQISGEIKSATGDLWTLDQHKLFCGDSRDFSSVRKGFQNDEIDLVYGGPPYWNLRQYSHWENFDDYLNDMSKVIENCFSHLKEGGIIVWNIGNLSTEHIDLTAHHSLLLQNCGFQYLDTIAWTKSTANFSVMRNAHIARNKMYYPTFQWEALLVFQKPGKMPKMTAQGAKYMSNFQSNVWEIPSVPNRIKRFGHPDVCPVELPYRCIQAYTGKNARVFEPFGGSGTTLIAAEKAGRQAFLVEQRPDYCDIIIKRWEDQTGKKASR
jgi:DNA modification methylase